jgi:hypothetical protein
LPFRHHLLQVTAANWLGRQVIERRTNIPPVPYTKHILADLHQQLRFMGRNNLLLNRLLLSSSRINIGLAQDKRQYAISRRSAFVVNPSFL